MIVERQNELMRKIYPARIPLFWVDLDRIRLWRKLEANRVNGYTMTETEIRYAGATIVIDAEYLTVATEERVPSPDGTQLVWLPPKSYAPLWQGLGERVGKLYTLAELLAGGAE